MHARMIVCYTGAMLVCYTGAMLVKMSVVMFVKAQGGSLLMSWIQMNRLMVAVTVLSLPKSYGVDAFDSSAFESFTLQVYLLWTINEFPAYANLSGWSIKGRVACSYKLSNLKSHDCHILMQDLLLICLRGVVEKKVLSVITNLSDFFKRLYTKSLDPQEVDQLQMQVLLTLCEIGKIFPSSFFTIMIYLIIHLPMEAKLGRPVQYRWMYPIERNVGNIKKWYIFSFGGRPIGTMNTKILDMRSLAQANSYILLHIDKLSPYRQEFLESQQATYDGIQISKRTEDKLLVEKFPKWLANQVNCHS
ncbi:hypothetical protein PVK06_019884 [Gossypium arboreum]|uniref:DUF4218 domain-containing protein n=1 Tax=Gossypium arboreum TaxID=29729 RepID=A0ABR0PKW7_GOSAR|nr:hypothetical protein PVK06_019884 [Gossypium arboreum]